MNKTKKNKTHEFGQYWFVPCPQYLILSFDLDLWPST